MVSDQKLSRTNKPKEDTDEEEKPIPVSAGPAGLALDVLVNPGRHKLKEFTSIDRWQARFFPLIDVTIKAWDYIFGISEYRQNPQYYLDKHNNRLPVASNFLDELLYSTAQWNRSKDAKNLDKFFDIVLAEVDKSIDDEDMQGGQQGPTY